MRGGIRDKASRTAVPQTHSLAKKMAALRVERCQQEHIPVRRFRRVQHDSQHQAIARNRHHRKSRKRLAHFPVLNQVTAQNLAIPGIDHRQFARISLRD